MDIIASSQKIYLKLKTARNILLVCHPQPDADALGSLAAFSLFLNQLGKKHDKFCLNQPPGNLAWLLNFEPLLTDLRIITGGQYDLLVILDSGDLHYAGLEKVLSQGVLSPAIINIDHHITNQGYGDLNLVLPTAASTTEIIYQFFKTLKIKITLPMANAILAGIICDTYNFTNPNTTFQSLAVASQLLLVGASLSQISDLILKNKTIQVLKIWGEILTDLNYNTDFGIATTVVDQAALVQLNNSAEMTEGVADFLNNLTGVKASLILRQTEPGLIKGSFRTNDDLIDVAKLAKILGGGGHRKAAGFKIKGQLARREDGGWQVV
jgi:phosphoesterase RecJ-like protein